MLKHLKYCLSAQLVLTTLTYGDIYSRDQERAEELIEENNDDFYLVLSDQQEESDENLTDTKIQNNTYGANTGTSTPTKMEIATKKKYHYSFFGEMLYLKPYFQGAPAINVQNQELTHNINSSLSSNYQTGELKTFDLDPAFGFRLGFGFKTHWMGIENQLIWMRYHTSTEKKYPTSVFYTYLVESYWNASFSEPDGKGYKISYHTKIDWDLIDLTSKIPLMPVKRLTLSPKIGVRGLISEVKAKIQDIKTAYGATQNVFTPPQNTQTNKLSQKYNAIGLLVGFDTDLDLGLGFHFDTIFNAAAVFGQLDTKNIGNNGAPTIYPSSIDSTYISKSSFYTVLPIIDAQLKFSWKKEYNKFGFDISVGYEIEYAPNFLQLVRLTDSRTEVENYDFSMQGLNVGLGISF